MTTSYAVQFEKKMLLFITPIPRDTHLNHFVTIQQEEDKFIGWLTLEKGKGYILHKVEGSSDTEIVTKIGKWIKHNLLPGNSNEETVIQA